MREVVGSVHERIRKMFPFLVAEGWSYKGFGASREDGNVFIHLRFERTIRGRLAFARVMIAAVTFDAPGYDLKEWIRGELRKTEEAMTNRFVAEFAGAA